MQNSIAMNSDIKALLTLWLLKTGTNAQEIHTALQVAAASRVMVAEENAGPSREEAAPTPNNVAKFRPASEALAVARRQSQQADAMNSDIKALLTLSLLKIGATSNEIQTALRLAAASRVAASEERAEPARSETPVQREPIADTTLAAAGVGPIPAAVNDTAPAVAASEPISVSAKQSLRNDQLAPISIHEFAAA
jgi:ribosomal protein L7/L12